MPLGLQGPSMTVDTACSSSLVAVHLACQSLWSGESQLALAGGANVILQPHITIAYSQSKMMAPDGRCKFGDARADGYTRSEGAGLVVLKRLSRALADHDPIYAVIRGSAVNNDGRTSGFLATPGQLGQQQLLSKAYRDAGVSPGQVQYVEAHGTGTAAGDPVEIQALGAVLAADRPAGQPCAIGSVKTNIGHTEGAAGVAGLIKVALSLQRRRIPASLHVQQLNPNIPWNDLPLALQRGRGPWPANPGPALAGVSAFGIAGTNAHVVLQEAPQQTLSDAGPAATVAQLLPLSAKSQVALREMARSYLSWMRAAPQDITPALRDVCYTAGVRRTHHEHRLAITARTREELAERLAAFGRGEVAAGFSCGDGNLNRRKVAFVFPGQGSQWIGMGRQLLAQEPIFRDALQRCDRALKPLVGWSVLDCLSAKTPEAPLEQIDVVQPALFAIEVALAAVWRSWGVEPDAVIGHSMGEVAAAHVAGALSLEDAALIITRRSQLMKRVSGRGAMALVELSFEDAQAAIAGYAGRLSVAVNNGRQSCVLSGDPAALDQAMAELQSQGVFCRPVKVDVAAHSPQMDPLRAELVQQLSVIQPIATSTPLYSTVTGEAAHGVELDAAYWGRNLREPVLFSAGMQRMVRAGFDTFVEMSPHPILAPAIEREWPATPPESGQREGNTILALPSLRREEDERAAMLNSLGALYASGFPIDWDRLYPTGGNCVRLPAYPWQRERFWLTEAEVRPSRWDNRLPTSQTGLPAHPLLQHHLQSPAQPGTHFWESYLSLDSLPYLADHRVRRAAVLPAAAMIELAWTAAGEVFGPNACALEQVHFKQALILPETKSETEAEGRIIQLIIAPQTASTWPALEPDGAPLRATFQIYSRPVNAAPRHELTDPPGAWSLHATGTIVPSTTPAQQDAAPGESPGSIQASCTEVIAGDEHYRAMTARGLQYGPQFQGVTRVWRRGRNAGRSDEPVEALGQLLLPEDVASADLRQLHPATLDAGLQVLLSTLNPPIADDPGVMAYLPVRVRSFRIPDPARLAAILANRASLWAHAVRRTDAAAADGTLEGDVFVLDDDGRLLVAIEGLGMHRLAPEHPPEPSQLFYDVQWLPRPHPLSHRTAEASRAPEPGAWIIFADRGGAGQAFAAAMTSRGATCVVVSAGESYRCASPLRFELNPSEPGDMRRLLRDAFGDGTLPCRGIAHLWSLDAAAPEDTTLATLAMAQQAGCLSVTHLVQALAESNWPQSPRLWLVTRGAQAVEPGESAAIAQTPVWGLGGVVAHEFPGLRCTRVDLTPLAGGNAAQNQTADDARLTDLHALLREFEAEDHEDQIAVRGDKRYVARLTAIGRPAEEETRVPAQAQPEPPAVSDLTGIHPPDSGDMALRVEITEPGILDHLALRPAPRPRPGAGEVLIHVRATGLNFMNVMSALGICPGYDGGVGPLGIECSGAIAAVGEGVAGMRIGDDVIAIAFDSLGTHALADAHLVLPKPPHLSFEQAAGIPIAFVTAYYALHYLGRLSRGERVLIHSASGGVGLAAVQLAQRAGAEIYATAGSPEKRAFLQSLGIRHVMDSRTVLFADEVMAHTGGQGVDVILNSLAGEAIAKGLSVLAPYGRFLELGKRDIYQNGVVELAPFRKNLSYFAIDLDLMGRERPAFVAALFREVLQLFAPQDERIEPPLKPLPTRTFPVANVADAFRHMAQAKHIGKIVVAMQDAAIPDAASSAGLGQVAWFKADATYLISGGAGGLGMTVARWMVGSGARHVVLLGRSGEASLSEGAASAVEGLRQGGAQVVVARADVAREEELAAVLSDVERTMPPLKGIIHAAGVLDDGILLHLNAERFRSVMSPKVDGAWNLHRLTANQPLDFFWLFSSVAGVLGSPGQGNYAAANAFLDGLAHFRRAQGRPALAIDWGPWTTVGLAARLDNERRAQESASRDPLAGVAPLDPDQNIRALEQLLRLTRPGGAWEAKAQVSIMQLDARKWCESHPADKAASLFTPLIEDREPIRASSAEPANKGTQPKLRDALLAAEPGRRRQSMLEAHVREQAARVLSLAPARIDLHKPLRSLGMDSLMALEFRNRIEATLGLSLSATLAWNYPTIADLVPYLADQMNIRLGQDSSGPDTAGLKTQENDEKRAALESLSTDEVQALLAEELGEIDSLLKRHAHG